MSTFLHGAVVMLAMLAWSSEARSFDVEQALRNTAAHINRTTPRRIGDVAYLDGAEAYGRSLKYRFSFRHLLKEEVSSAFVLKQTEFLNHFVCTTPEMQVFVEHGVELKYAYHDKRGKLVTIIAVDARTCSHE